MLAQWQRFAPHSFGVELALYPLTVGEVVGHSGVKEAPVEVGILVTDLVERQAAEVRGGHGVNRYARPT